MWPRYELCGWVKWSQGRQTDGNKQMVNWGGYIENSGNNTHQANGQQ